MKFLRPGGGSIEFVEEARTTLMSYRQLSSNAQEAGGMLLGRLIDETRDVVIDEVTVPTRKDRRGRFSFFRSKETAQRRVSVVWAESGHTQIYLGEWHTHPENDPSPSGKDLKNWLRIGRSAKYGQKFLLFVIVGRDNIRMWELDKGRKAPALLEPG